MKHGFYTVLVLLFVVLGMRAVLFYEGEDQIDPVSDTDTELLVEIAFLDIGQGDATFITFPNGVQMLIDCAIDARVLEALGRVMPFYDKTIDYLVVTHPDKDHYGGCIDVLHRFDVATIVHTGVGKDNRSWEEMLRAMKAEGAELRQIDQEQMWSIASTTLHFLYPDADVSGATDKFNDTSIVIKFSYGESDVLLPGDAEQWLEQYLINNFKNEIDVEVLKVSHHGSGGSSIKPFLEATAPEHAIISAGKDNRYGHPSRRVIKRLERVSSTIWQTAIHGDIEVKMFPDRIEIE